MDKLERIGKQSMYDDMVKPPCASAMAAGKRRPAYINYTPEGRKKSRAAAGLAGLQIDLTEDKQHG